MARPALNSSLPISISSAPEADKIAEAAGDDLAADRDADDGCIIAPGTAADHAKSSGRRPLRIHRCRAIKRSIPIRRPFLNISQNVVQPKRIRLLLSDAMRRIAAVVAVPSNLVQRAVTCLRFSSARGIFPFRLRRQPHSRAPAIRYGVVPRNIVHRHLIAPKITRIEPVICLYAASVTGVWPSQNPAEIVTECTGFSALPHSESLGEQPIWNVPGGIQT